MPTLEKVTIRLGKRGFNQKDAIKFVSKYGVLGTHNALKIAPNEKDSSVLSHLAFASSFRKFGSIRKMRKTYKFLKGKKTDSSLISPIFRFLKETKIDIDSKKHKKIITNLLKNPETIVPITNALIHSKNQEKGKRRKRNNQTIRQE